MHCTNGKCNKPITSCSICLEPLEISLQNVNINSNEEKGKKKPQLKEQQSLKKSSFIC